MELERIRIPMRSSRWATPCARCSINFGFKMSQLKISEMPQEERPREKLAAHGAGALTDSELIAILLRTGIPGANAIEVARKLLNDYGSLGELSRCTVDELSKIRGVGFAKAVQLVAAFGLGQ